MAYLLRKAKITTLFKYKQAIKLFFLKKSFLFFTYSLVLYGFKGGNCLNFSNHKEHKSNDLRGELCAGPPAW